MTFQTTPSTLLPLPDSETNTQLPKPDTRELPFILLSLHTRSLEPFTSHIQSLGSFPKSLHNLSYSNVLAPINIASGLFQRPFHWSSLPAASYPPAKASSTPALCSSTCCSDGLSLASSYLHFNFLHATSSRKPLLAPPRWGQALLLHASCGSTCHMTLLPPMKTAPARCSCTVHYFSP